MRNLLSLFTVLGAYSILYAQSGIVNAPLTGQVRNEIRTHSLRNGALGTQYYLETFDEGLSDWTSSTEVGVVHWKWTDEGPGPTTSFYPVPPLNTTPGWAILDDDHDGFPGHTCQASLISPVIDLTNAPADLKLQFDQYFQEYQSDNTYVGISTDGGYEWNEVEINQGVGRDNRPVPESVILNISEWIADDPSNVRIRFRYTADWAYGWQIDNVGIYEPPPYEMEIVQASLSHVPDGGSYGRIPTAQLDGSFHAIVEIANAGLFDLTDVQVTIEIRNQDHELVYTGQTEAIDIGQWDMASLEHICETASLLQGIYRVTFTASYAQIGSDEDPENNLLTRNFEVNDAFFSIDGIGIHPAGTEQLTSLGTDSFEDAQDGLFLMNLYEITDPLMVHGIQFEMGANSSAGGFVYASLVSAADAINGQMSNNYAETPLHDLTQEDIDAGVLNLFFPEPVQLLQGDHYAAVALHSLAGSAHVRVIDDNSIPRSDLAALINIPNDDTYTNGNAFAIRLILDPTMVSVDRTLTVPEVSIWPNPAHDLINVSAHSSDTYALKIFDPMGSVVHVGSFTGSITIGTSHLASGVYLIEIVGPASRMISRMIRSH